MTTEEFLAERRLRAAELALESARHRVREADAEIADLRGQVATLEEEAERRVRELQSELELVRQRTADLEQQVRRAVDEAWRWLADTGERVNVSLAEIELWRAGNVPWAPAFDPEDELLRRPAPADAGRLSGLYDPKLSQRPQPSAAEGQHEVIPQRFDDALDRLRRQAAAEAGEDAATGSEPSA